MNERCADCPWFNHERNECRRKPPRFCEVDGSVNSDPTPVPTGTPRANDTPE